MKKKRPEHSNHDRWLVSYADFMTLLFALFVVLYSSSQIDKKKAGHLAAAIQVAFQELGVFRVSSGALALPDEAGEPLARGKSAGSAQEKMDPSQIVASLKERATSAAEVQSLKDARELIEKALSGEIQRKEVSVSARREGLVVSLKEVGFFDSGSASIRPASLGAIERLVEVLKSRPEALRIEGHTDDVPIHNAQFASNWELSTARATEMISVLITRFGLPPEHLSAAGYGQFHPIAPNDTAAGRAQNRRLDVVILAEPQESQ